MRSVALIDADTLVHIIAHRQWAGGNKGNRRAVELNVDTFLFSILKKCKCDDFILMFQGSQFKNYRNILLPEYKSHRTSSPATDKWKPVILDKLRKFGGLELEYIESDDAQSILANVIGYDRTTLITSDKDMLQVPCTLYNPYKANLNYKDRFTYPSRREANLSLYTQVLTGDSTDMPNSLCGIEGIGPGKANTALRDLDESEFSTKVISMYKAKYGQSGIARAVLTYRLVRTLTGCNKDYYISQEAKLEVEKVTNLWSKYIQEVKSYDDAESLFESMGMDDLDPQSMM